MNERGSLPKYELYDPEGLKERFLEKYKNPGTRKKYEIDLANCGEFERANGKDLYEFTINEWQDMFSSGFGRRTSVSLISTRSSLSMYLNFCIEQGYVKNPIDLKTIIKREDVKDNVNKTAMQKQYLTKEQIKNMCVNELVNAQDSVSPALLFSGLTVDEIINLRNQDCKVQENLIYIQSRDTSIKVEDWVMEIIYDAINGEEYHKENGMAAEKETVKAPSVVIPKTDYVVRFTRNLKGVNPMMKVTLTTIAKRLTNACMILDLPYVTTGTVHKSGLFNLLKEIKEEKGMLTIQDYKDARVRFGLNEIGYFDTKDEFEQLLTMQE